MASCNVVQALIDAILVLHARYGVPEFLIVAFPFFFVYEYLPAKPSEEECTLCNDAQQFIIIVLLVLLLTGGIGYGRTRRR